MRQLPESDALPAANDHIVPGIFVHIRKTAGSSFREALEARSPVICDYGNTGPKTSDIVKRYKYETSDRESLRHQLRGSKAWLAGHFPLKECADLVDCRKITTLVRHPVDRVISHFNHARAYLYAGARIENFVRKKRTRNEQCRMLQGVPLGCIGYVGVTEQFSESLEMINSGLQLNLEHKHSNVNQYKSIQSSDVTDDLRDMIIAHNQQDMALYQRVCEQHEQRYRFFNLGKPWCHGYYTLCASGHIQGVAFYADSDDVVEVEVRRAGEILTRLPANQLQQGEPHCVLPRSRRVAFDTALPGTAGDIEVVVAATGQRLALHH